MVDLQTKIKEWGYKNEAIQQASESVVYGVDTIVAGEQINKLVRHILPWGIPSYEITSVAFYLENNNRGANEFRVILKELEFGLTGDPINLLPFFLFMGASSTDASSPPIHTITAAAIGTDNPHGTVRFRYKSDSIEKIQHITGVKLVSLFWSLDLRSDKKPSLAMIFRGDSLQDPTDATIKEGGTDVTPVFPTGGTQQIYNRVNTITWFKGNVGGTELDISSILDFVTIGLNDGFIIIGPEIDQTEIKEIINGTHIYIITLRLKRGLKLEVINYFNTITNATTKADVFFRFQFSTTKYIEFTFTGVQPMQGVKMPQSTREQEFDEFNFSCKSITIAGPDGLSKVTYYGESA